MGTAQGPWGVERRDGGPSRDRVAEHAVKPNLASLFAVILAARVMKMKGHKPKAYR